MKMIKFRIGKRDITVRHQKNKKDYSEQIYAISWAICMKWKDTLKDTAIKTDIKEIESNSPIFIKAIECAKVIQW